MGTNRRRRRKAKPFNPNQTKQEKAYHDRRAIDLLRNAQVAVAEVDDPYAINPGDKIVVLRSTRHDPLADMINRNQIDHCDYVAGRRWQAAYENAAIGGARAIDPTREAVDGGAGVREVMTDVQRRAMWDLKAARMALGEEGNNLVLEVLGAGLSIRQVILKHQGTCGEAAYKYAGRRFRECLATLAKRFGLSNESHRKAKRRLDRQERL